MKLQLIAAVASVLFSVVPGAFAEHKLRPKAQVDAEDYEDYYASDGDFDPEDEDFDLIGYVCNPDCYEQLLAGEIDFLAYHACCGGGGGGGGGGRRRGPDCGYYELLKENGDDLPEDFDFVEYYKRCGRGGGRGRRWSYRNYGYRNGPDYSKAGKGGPPGPGPSPGGRACYNPRTGLVCSRRLNRRQCARCGGDTCAVDSRLGCHSY